MGHTRPVMGSLYLYLYLIGWLTLYGLTECIINERMNEVYVCFTDWQKASDCLNWAKLMQILKNTGNNWCEDEYQQTACGLVLLKDWAKNI